MNPDVHDRADIDEHTAEVIDDAVDELGARAGLWGVASEPGLQLFLLGCLKAELDARVLDTVWNCRAHDFTWKEIGDLLGVAAEITQGRYDDSDPTETASS